MKVEIIVDPSRVPPAPLTSRLGVAPTASAYVLLPFPSFPPLHKIPTNHSSPHSTLSAASGSARQPRNPAGAGRGGRAPRVPRPKATVESLDAEMSDYQAAKGEVA